MHQLKIWFLASRPKTLIISISPVLIGTTMAMTEGFFSFWMFFFTLLTGLFIQIGTNLANDYFDFLKGADTSARKGPLRVMQAGLVTPLAMQRALTLVFASVLIFGSYLIVQGGILFAFLIALAILLAILYTGGPFPLAYLGLGELFVFIVFGPLAVTCTYYLQTHSIHPAPIIAGLITGCIPSAILAVNNLRDVEEDRAANKKTLIVRYGIKFGKFEYLFLLLASLIPPLVYAPSHPLLWLCLLMLFPCVHLFIHLFKNPAPQFLNLIFVKTAKFLFFYTLLFCFIWML